jgi:hypothetical protein
VNRLATTITTLTEKVRSKINLALNFIIQNLVPDRELPDYEPADNSPEQISSHVLETLLLLDQPRLQKINVRAAPSTSITEPNFFTGPLKNVRQTSCRRLMTKPFTGAFDKLKFFGHSHSFKASLCDVKAHL